jgi:hypothetical protein
MKGKLNVIDGFALVIAILAIAFGAVIASVLNT